VSLVSPAEVKNLVPYIDESIILGGFYTPGVGVVDSLRMGTLMREEGQASGALVVFPKTEVTGIDVEHGRVRRVRTTQGDIEVETVVITCGVWSPRIARMAGAHIPLTPAVHQMIDVGPVPRFKSAKSDIEHPIVRDMDTNMYERQAGGDLEIGSYAHRPILYDPEDLPSVEQAALSPTEFPFTQADFELQMQHALELMPEIVGDESVGVKYAINGILSLTPDGMPVLGESPDVRGLWAAAAVWVKEGPGTGKALAEWMVHGESEIDLHSSDIARFHEHQKTRAHVRARAAEGFNKTYGIVHPAEQWASNRGVRLAPFHERERELGATFFEAAGWERPQWYESNAPLLEEFGDRVTRRTAEWECRWWSPIINAEHLAMRERAGLFDLSAFTIFDIAGPGALKSVQCVALRQMDVPEGRVVYTPVLSPNGGFKSDLTIMRLGENRFRVVTGFGHAPEHASLMCDDGRVLIAGDMVLPSISTNVSVYDVEPEADPLSKYLDSIDRLGALPADTLVLPSHGLPFFGLQQRVSQLHAHHRVRLEATVQACATARTAHELVPVLFRRKLDEHQVGFAFGETLSHLHHLWYQGVLRRERGADHVYRFSRA